MKYVAVKHKPEHTNVWWFMVPDELGDKVSVGNEVICATARGKANGKVVQMMDGISQESAERIIGNHFPLKSVVAVSVELPLSDIHIPLILASSNPSEEKISKRMHEFYKYGKFNTPVIYSTDGTLRDGYTAYLVAKMFDHDTLKGFCSI